MKENIEEDIIKKFENPQYVNLITLIRQFKKEGLESFIVLRKNNFDKILSDYKKLQEEFKQVDHECDRLEQKEVRLQKENEELKEELFMLKTKTKRQKIKDLECHCGECDDEIYRICEKYCNYQDDEVALCERERFANMDIEDYEKIEKTLRIEKKMEDLIEKLQKENEELKEEIMLAPNLDEMTAVKYINIQKEAYIKGRAEEQQKAEQIICEQYISKQKIKDKIEELNKKEQELQNSISDEEREEYSDASISFDLMDIHIRREELQDLLEEKGE